MNIYSNDPITGFLRLPDVLKLYPVSKSTWWAGVKDGRYPKPIKLGPKITAWRSQDIINLIEQITENGGVACSN